MPIRTLLAKDHVIVHQGFRVLLKQVGMVVIRGSIRYFLAPSCYVLKFRPK
jgi:DNA-binding NarL/FixJ family response regulator